MPKKKGGWYGESQRHALAAKGVKTGTKDRKKDAKRAVGQQSEETMPRGYGNILDMSDEDIRRAEEDYQAMVEEKYIEGEMDVPYEEYEDRGLDRRYITTRANQYFQLGLIEEEMVERYGGKSSCMRMADKGDEGAERLANMYDVTMARAIEADITRSREVGAEQWEAERDMAHGMLKDMGRGRAILYADEVNRLHADLQRLRNREPTPENKERIWAKEHEMSKIMQKVNSVPHLVQNRSVFTQQLFPSTYLAIYGR